MIIGEIYPKQMTDFITKYFDDPLLIGFFLWVWKLLFIGFSEERRVISVDVEKSETRLVGLIGHIDHGAKRIGAKRRVRYVLDRLNLVNDGRSKNKESRSKPKSITPQTSSVIFKFIN